MIMRYKSTQKAEWYLTPFLGLDCPMSLDFDGLLIEDIYFILDDRGHEPICCK